MKYEPLELFKYDTVKDKNKAFNIDEALNENWDRIIERDLLRGDAINEASTAAKTVITDDQAADLGITDPDKKTVEGGLEKLGADNKELSGRNLADNGDFRIPVNQRVQKVYNSRGYTIDRWMLLNGSATITVADGCLTLKGSDEVGAFDYLSSPLEILASLIDNMQITLSVQTRDGTIYSMCGIYTTNAAPGRGVLVLNVGSNGLILYVCKDVSGCVCVMFRIPANTTTDVLRCKFEIGSISTLANDPPANYAAELELCKRYYQIVESANTGLKLESDNVFFTVNHYPEMRIAPTVIMPSSYTDLLGCIDSPNLLAPTAYVAYSSTENQHTFKHTVNGAKSGLPYYLRDKIIYDAEIY